MKTDWNRRTWRIAWPIMLSNVSVPLLGAVDMAVVGHLPGPQYLGAVAVGALVFTVAYHGFIFLRMGTTGLTAQALGAGRADEVRAWLARAGLLGGAIGALLIALQIPIAWLGIQLIGPEPETAGLAEAYIRIRIWGAPAALFNFALLGWFFGIQNSGAALVTQLFMNGLNIGLDLLFVAGFGWGVEGVAWATLISEISTVFLGLWLAAMSLRRIGGRWERERITDLERMRRMLRVNADIFVRSIVLQVCFAAITAIGARIGPATLAANAILFNLLVFTAYILDGFSNAAEALTGEAIGRRDPVSFRHSVFAAGRGAFIGGLVLTLVFWVAGPAIIDLMTTVPEVRAETREYLIWAIAMPMVSVWSFLYDGIFIGSTWTRAMRDGMILSAIGYVALLALFVPVWGNHGLWLAVSLFMASRALTLALRYPRLSRTVGTAPH